jgi:nitroreductase
MHRRDFIRLVGGGAVIAALPGCSSDLPAGAVAPWQGPGPETELRRWALAHAILAPNSHNRQPWVADLREPSAIRLHVDRERLLPETDPWFRQIVVSQGTFIEALVMALHERGVTPEVTLFPEGAFAPRQLDDRPVARIAWNPNAPAGARDPLFTQILRRHTAKVDYDTSRPVAADAIAALQASQADAQVHFGATTDPRQVEALRRLCWESARVELLTERTVMESIRLTRVGPDEINRHRDGISINAFVPRLANAVGAFDRTKPPAEGTTAYRQMMSRFEGHSRTAMGFVWLSTDTSAHAAANTTRHAEVRAGRAYMRLQLAATRIGLQVHPMSQAVQEFPEMKPHFDELHRLLVGKPASQETVQMFCRMGYVDEAAALTPRRGVDAIIRT